MLMNSNSHNGNGCGHDPTHFRRFVPPAHNHPRILEEARKRIGDCVGGFWNELFTGTRQKRSERREACGVLLSCLIHRVDLVTLRVGIPMEGGKFRAYTDFELARMTGLGIRRLERAMQDLVDIGFIKVQPRCKRNSDGHCIGLAAIRTISLAFFDLIGLGKKIRKERKKASDRSKFRSLAALSRDTFAVIQKALRGNKKASSKTRSEHLDDLIALKHRFKSVSANL